MLPIDKPSSAALSAITKEIPEESLIACLKLNLDKNGKFSETWLFSDKSFLYVVENDSEKSQQNEIKATRKYELSRCERITVDSFVSSCRFVIYSEGKSHLIAHATNSCRKKLSVFCEVLERLKKGNDISPLDPLFSNLDIFCEKCGRPYNDPARKLCISCIDKKAIVKRMYKYFKPHKKKVFLILFFLCSSVFLGLLSPYLGSGFLFGRVLNPNEPNSFVRGNIALGIGLILGSAALVVLLNILRVRVSTELSLSVRLAMKTELFEKLQYQSISYFSSTHSGKLITRVNHDTEIVQGFFVDTLQEMFMNLVYLVVATVILFILDPMLALLVFIPIPLYIIVVRKQFPKLWKGYTVEWRKRSAFNSVLGDTLSGLRVVKAFAKEESETHRFSKYSNDLMKSQLKLNALHLCLSPVISIIVTLSINAIWGFGGILVMDRMLEYALFLTFINYTSMLFNPIAKFSLASETLAKAINSMQRMIEIMDCVPEITESKNPVSIPEMKGEIEFKNVSFHYNINRPILKNISFRTNAGESVGLVGHTGAGKSTIINLITRLYDVVGGEILIDGINIKDIRLADLRKNIAVVSQEVYLFAGTIAENIAYADRDASKERIVEAAKAANAHDFIMALPEGYETLIGQGHRALSGGEKQRISIARALLTNPRILILDEATAAMDTKTELLIQDALSNLIKGKTTITIAHRLSTLKDCDTLYALSNGCIVEHGTHGELLEKKGVYHKLYTLQLDAMKKIMTE